MFLMKKSIKLTSHTGEQPIRVLKHNISHRFENLHGDFAKEIQKMINSGKLFPGIHYHITPRALTQKQMPFVDETGKVNIHETYMSYVWINCFSLFVMYEEGVAKPMQKKQGQANIQEVDVALLNITEELFQYGKSLIVAYSPWDKKYLPNPEEFSNEEEFYVLRTNGLYMYAMTFILAHEYAHIELDHFNKKNQSSIEQEIEADKRAIELLLNCRDDKNKKTVEYGLLMGFVSMLFLKNNVYGKNTHPDIDERIKTYLAILDAPSEEPIWGIATLAIKLWDNQFQLGFSYPTYVDDFKQFFYEMCSQIKK